jgi:hypothetical protein
MPRWAVVAEVEGVAFTASAAACQEVVVDDEPVVLPKVSLAASPSNDQMMPRRVTTHLKTKIMTTVPDPGKQMRASL